MKQFLLSSFIVLLCCLDSFAQTTYINGKFTTGDGVECARLHTVRIQDDGVIVTIEVKALKDLKRLRILCSENTFIKSGNIKLLQLSGLLINGSVQQCGFNTNWGWDKLKAGETRTYDLYFAGTMPSGITSFSIVDEGDYSGTHGYCFRNYTINNPRKNYVNVSSIEDIKQRINSNNDGICGIYEPIGGTGASIACIKQNGEYKMIYVSSPPSYPYKEFWSIGDIKANLRKTASDIMSADWYNSAKMASGSAYVKFDGVSLKAIVNGEEISYLKTFPISSSNIGGTGTQEGWTGTGFALKNGYIVTNYHVVENSTSIVVVGVNGNHNTEYKAIVVTTDKKNDLALIRINDYRISYFPPPPYAVTNRQCEVGEDVFVLGYPLTSYMGEEIKLTNGIISSRSGYQGDITTYQISAPVQPGNSGGPMFDKNGNVVGIVNAGIPGAENVGYAIKCSYLFNLVGSATSNTNIPHTNHVTGYTLADKVKSVKDYVYYIKCKGT